MKNAIILCSGGIDSTVTAYYVKHKLSYESIKILFFNYNQKSIKEERSASRYFAKQLNAKFIEISLPELHELSTSLINVKGKVNKIRKDDLKDTKKESKNWYVPARNLVFISYASALADSIFIKEKVKSDIFLGFKCEGKDSYPDTTKEFTEKANKLLSNSSSYPIKIKTPLIDMNKEDIIILGLKLGVKLEHTFSCYSPKNHSHCGFCLACALRKHGFYWANIKDKTRYLR